MVKQPKERFIAKILIRTSRQRQGTHGILTSGYVTMTRSPMIAGTPMRFSCCSRWSSLSTPRPLQGGNSIENLSSSFGLNNCRDLARDSLHWEKFRNWVIYKCNRIKEEPQAIFKGKTQANFFFNLIESLAFEATRRCHRMCVARGIPRIRLPIVMV